MPRTIPTFTLPLCGFPGFAADTQRSLEALFENPPAAGSEQLRALVLVPHGVMNSGQPHTIQFLMEDEDGVFSLPRAFDVPETVRGAAAAASFLTANDPAVDHMLASMSLTVRHARHNRFAITHRGCVSWRPTHPGCARAKAVKYQEYLDAGDALLGYVAGRVACSSHQLMVDLQTLLPLAEGLYRANIQGMSQKKRVGLYRKVAFRSSPDVRNPRLAISR